MLQKRLQRYFPHAPPAQKRPIKHGWSATFFDLNHFLLSKKKANRPYTNPFRKINTKHCIQGFVLSLLQHETGQYDD
jgi:hypothetical protein